MKNILLTFFCAAAFFACKPVKKVQNFNEAISKKDTISPVKIDQTVAVDSNKVVKDILATVIKNKIDFTTFNAKVKFDYDGQESSQHATAYIGIRKDSAIFAKIVGPLGVVALQVQITKDSIILVNKIDKYVQYRSITYLQEAAQIPFDFSTLQDIIIGNPIFMSKNIVSYKSTNDKLLVLMVGNLFKHLITLDKKDNTVTHSKLDDVDPQRNRTCDVTLTNFKNENGIQFATYRSISVSEKSKLDVYLDFKDYKFNEPLNYTFTVPKNYKRK